MKKSILLLAFLPIGIGIAFAQKKAPPAKRPAAATAQKAGNNTLSCTINGKACTATGSQVHAVATLKVAKVPPYQEIMVFNNTRSLNHCTLSFYLAQGAVLAPGTYTASDFFSDDAKFPNVAFQLMERKAGDVGLFENTNDGSGTVTITSVAGGTIKGTFVFNLEGTTGTREITNGSFKFRMPPVETD